MTPVVLVSLDWLRPHDPRRSLGTASLYASLLDAGAPVWLVEDAVNDPDFDLERVASRIVEALEAAGPAAWLGIGAFVWNEPEVAALVARFARSRAMVLGGPQISFATAGTLEDCYPGVRAFIRGHGEPGIVAIAAGRAVEGELGVHLAGEVDRGARADVPLDTLASPYLTGALTPTASTRWETQRGCPYACSFCQHREPGSRLRHRHLDHDRLLAELVRFTSADVRRISVLDPIFHRKGSRAVELLRAARELGLQATLSLQCRAELLDAEFLDALDGLDVHLELGLQTAVEAEGRAVGRPNNLGKVDVALQELRRRNISHEISLIYGLPGQTLESFQHSVSWCLERQVPTVRAWPLMLLRGTPLANERSKWGFVEEALDGRIPIVVQSDTMSRADHARMAEIAAALPDADRAGRPHLLGGVA